MIFWFVAGLLIALALAFVLPPFLRKSSPVVSQENSSSRDLNISIYQERLDELKQLNLSETDFAQAKTELDKTLLEDIQTEQTISPETQPRGRWAAVVVLIILPILAIGTFWKTGHFAILETIQKAPSQTKQQAELNSLDEMVGRLVEKMKQNPEDSKGWVMLGRSYLVLERYAEAEQAYAKAVVLTKETDPDIVADYAEAIAFKDDGQIAGKPLELIQKNLNNFPDHPKSLWLVGLNAAQQENFKEAVQNWEKVLAQMPPNSEAWKTMQNHIQEAKKAGNLPVETKLEPKESQPIVSNVKLNVQIEVDPALQAQLQPEQTVFIYAHPTQNKMPLAMITKTAKELPLNVTLDDSQAMLPTAKLSQYQEVIISARISKTGTAAPQSGDVFGETGVIKINEVSQPIKITINQVVP
jgi:cytochrome c-type biogenesis protein CcmH